MATLKKRLGRPEKEAIRWNLQMVEREFDRDRRDLVKRVRALSIEHGKDGNYSSRQVEAILFGDKEAEVIAKLNAERRKTELDMEITRRERIPIEITNNVNAEAFGTIVGIIRAYRGKVLDQDAIDDINAAVRDIPAKLKWSSKT